MILLRGKTYRTTIPCKDRTGGATYIQIGVAVGQKNGNPNGTLVNGTLVTKTCGPVGYF